MFSSEFCKILKKTNFYRTPPVAASVLWKIVEDYKPNFRPIQNLKESFPAHFAVFLQIFGRWNQVPQIAGQILGKTSQIFDVKYTRLLLLSTMKYI